jgi:hypothetical protein
MMDTTLASIEQVQVAMQRVAMLPTALERGTSWVTIYCATACGTAAALWRLNRSDYAVVVDQNIRHKVIAPDYRYPLSDGLLSLARLRVLHDEATEWFAKARLALDEHGARTLRAISDYDECVLYMRRSRADDDERAQPVPDAARA